MAKIKGMDVSLSIQVSASPVEYELIGCGRTCSLTTTVDTAGKSTVGSGVWKEFKGLVNSWNINLDGLATIGDNMGIKQLRDYQYALTPLIVSFKEQSGANIIYYTGFAIITNVQTSGNYNDLETYSVQLQGTGELLTTVDENDTYGTAPTFEIDAVLPNFPTTGFTRLTFTAIVLSVPTPSSYTLRVQDNTASTTVYVTDIPFNAPGEIYNYVVTSAHSYDFYLKGVYDGILETPLSTVVQWP